MVLIDPPLNVDVRAVDCVALNRSKPTACAIERAKAQPPDPLTEVVRDVRDPKISYVDLTDYFCDAYHCYGVVGHVTVYYDASHLNIEFSRRMAPMIAATIGLGHR